jgi:hypothetical protein
MGENSPNMVTLSSGHLKMKCLLTKCRLTKGRLAKCRGADVFRFSFHPFPLCSEEKEFIVLYVGAVCHRSIFLRRLA